MDSLPVYLSACRHFELQCAVPTQRFKGAIHIVQIVYDRDSCFAIPRWRYDLRALIHLIFIRLYTAAYALKIAFSNTKYMDSTSKGVYRCTYIHMRS